MEKWRRYFFGILLLVLISGCAYGVSTSPANYPYDSYPTNEGRQWNKWFYGP